MLALERLRRAGCLHYALEGDNSVAGFGAARASQLARPDANDRMSMYVLAVWVWNTKCVPAVPMKRTHERANETRSDQRTPCRMSTCSPTKITPTRNTIVCIPVYSGVAPAPITRWRRSEAAPHNSTLRPRHRHAR